MLILCASQRYFILVRELLSECAVGGRSSLSDEGKKESEVGFVKDGGVVGLDFLLVVLNRLCIRTPES